MTTRIVHRPARGVRPPTRPKPVEINPPPAFPGGVGGGIGNLAMAVPMVATVLAMGMMTLTRGTANKSFMIIGAVVVVVSLLGVGVHALSQHGQSGRERKQQRAGYLNYLEDLREELQDQQQRLRAQLLLCYPPTDRLFDLINDPGRLWERRRTDPDFLMLRIGSGWGPGHAVNLRSGGDGLNPPDPFMVNEAESVVRRFRGVADVPLCVDLDLVGEVSIVAPQYPLGLDVVRVIISQLTASHAPEDVQLALIADSARRQQWSWVTWLPHIHDRERPGPAGPLLLVAPDAGSLAGLLDEQIKRRTEIATQARFDRIGPPAAAGHQRLVIIDDCHGRDAQPLPLNTDVDLGQLGITVIRIVGDRLQEPGELAARISVRPSRAGRPSDEPRPEIMVEQLAPYRARMVGVADPGGRARAEGLARELAAVRLSVDSLDDGTGTPPADFTEMLGLNDLHHLDLKQRWRSRSDRDFLRVPFGVIEGRAEPVVLDIKESAQQGMGPHGLCVGATGSGKSELLRTLVLALAATHPPEQLSMMLVDYKGGASFAPFVDLPHVAGMVTNLSGDAELVERMYASLDGEVLRRQQLLADAGRLSDVVEYRLKREQDPTLRPLPNLFVIIDEFGELLTAKPEFSELFLRIGRIGRSIGVHLLLSSQRLEAGKIRGLENYLSYRLGLRTLSDSESRTVLETPDAYRLPSVPGVGYLKVDVTVYQRFKAAYVSGPLETDEPADETTAAPVRVGLLPSYGRLSDLDPEEEDTDDDHGTARTTGPSLMSVITGQIAEQCEPGRAVQPIWLPPLPSMITLDEAAGGLDDTTAGPRLVDGPPVDGGARELIIPIGRLDDPTRQWQGSWQLDLSSAGGHALIIGAPASGKSYGLRTVALSIAASRTPTEVAIYGMDLLGNGLRTIADLPHVGGVAGRNERERLRRTIEELQAMIETREAYFGRTGIDNVESLYSDPDHRTELGCTEVVVLIDGFGQFLDEFDPYAEQMYDILARGSRYGIHVIATVRRWNEVRITQQVNFGNRIELRLTEPAESGIDAKVSRTFAKAPPGRGMNDERLVGQLALPRLDGVVDDAVDGTAESARLLRQSWTGPLPPRIRVLPPVVGAAEVLAEVESSGRRRSGELVLGRVEHDFSPAGFHLFGEDQHLVVLGDNDCGKSNLLRLLAGQLAGQLSSNELVFAVYDPRRGMKGVIDDAYLGGSATNPSLAQQLSSAIARELAARSTDPEKAATAPRIVLLIDDYDVLAASSTQPLAPLLPYVASGGDIGLHVIMTRRVMGASRGLFEPFTLSVRESGALTLLMSGDRGEGQLLPGIRASTLPVGRGQLIRPGEKPLMVQTALNDSGDAAE